VVTSGQGVRRRRGHDESCPYKGKGGKERPTLKKRGWGSQLRLPSGRRAKCTTEVVRLHKTRQIAKSGHNMLCPYEGKNREAEKKDPPSKNEGGAPTLLDFGDAAVGGGGEFLELQGVVAGHYAVDRAGQLDHSRLRGNVGGVIGV
jgi:hypothetical protein